MSGIYGFTCLTPRLYPCESALDALEYWNRIFGKQANDQLLLDNSAIGCHIEHFSDKFPYGGPILYHRGKPAVVDALLFNRDELIRTLDPADPSALSDEALLLELIDRKGFEALADVNGDFAGAIWDPADRTWTLFRDHFGVRPLYLYLDEHCFAFSTDLRGLLALPDADLSIDETQLYAHLTGSNFLSLQATEYARIKCALPAAVTQVFVTQTGFSVSEQTYWKIRQKKIRFKTDEEYRKELFRLVEDAVNRRCDAVPGLLGAELSGGLDSSVIDILISRHGRDCLYYSWSNDPEDLPLCEGTDERKVIFDICEQEQIKCRFLRAEDIAAYRKKRDLFQPAFINTLQIGYGSTWMKSQGAAAVFTGHGGDEGISHRASRFELFYNREYLSYFKLFWQDTKGKSFRLIRTLKRGFTDVLNRYKENRNYRLPYYPALNPQFSERLEAQFQNQEKYFNYAPHKYVMIGGTRSRLENTAYQGACSGVRYLFPYVDHRVLDFALSIPRRLYIDHKNNRVIFREAFRKIIPQSLYEVNYKYTASRRNQPKKEETEQKDESDFIKISVQGFLEKADRERWSDYLDFSTLEKLAQMDKTDPRRAGVSTMFIGELNMCLYLQNMQNRIIKWRSEHEQNNETV